jgi:hypothetical protein
MEGHKGVTFVLVPFDPEEHWSQKPVQLAGRRHGWLIAGTANGVRFEGYIGERWNRFFIMIDGALRDMAKVRLGEMLDMRIEPTSGPMAFAQAYAQSKVTTQPKKARADVIRLKADRS